MMNLLACAPNGNTLVTIEQQLATMNVPGSISHISLRPVSVANFSKFSLTGTATTARSVPSPS